MLVREEIREPPADVLVVNVLDDDGEPTRFLSGKFLNPDARPPIPGSLTSVAALCPGDEDTNYVTISNEKIPALTAYVTIVATVDGSQEIFNDDDVNTKEAELNVDAFNEAAKMAIKAKKQARMAKMNRSST